MREEEKRDEGREASSPIPSPLTSRLSPLIWALTDDRAGHTSQTLGLAEALGLPYERKVLHTTLFSALPNVLLGASLAGIDSVGCSKLTPPYPHLAIATGRRLVPVMRHLKHRSPDTLLVQCMWPGVLEPFDRIIVPAHDEVPDDPRILRTLGALHGLSRQRLAGASPAFVEGLTRPIIGLLVGGTTKAGSLSASEAARLIDLSELLSTGGSLAITTSRRTPRNTLPILAQRATCPIAFYRYGNPAPNPYHTLLAHSDALIVTGDSVSMLSEACFTARPVFVFETTAMLPKHRAFCQSLYDQGYAQPLTPESTLSALPALVLDEARKMGEKIKELLNTALIHPK